MARACARSGLSFEDVSDYVFERIRLEAGVAADRVVGIVSTGVGRHNCPSADRARSEITCIGRAGSHLLGGSLTVVDIGGQDNKIVHLDADGRVASFKMNRKCAAGTGAFIEEIAHRLDLEADEMNALASSTGESVEIGSYCTVFTGTEIIHHIRTGQRREAIIRGVYESVVKRIFEMDGLGERVFFSGGVVTTHPVLRDIFEDMLGVPVHVPEHPQFTGAIGAALYAAEAGVR